MAYAGHAGDMGGPLMMPHELAGGMIIVALLILAVLILVGVVIWRLVKLERRLRALEHLDRSRHPLDSPSTPHSRTNPDKTP